MPLLYFWEQSRFLKDNSAPLVNEDLALSQESGTLVQAAGERMWVFTKGCDGEYALAAKVTIDRVEERGSDYGRYTAVPVPGSTVRYGLKQQANNVGALIKSLSIYGNAEVIGHAFQGLNAVRRIGNEDDARLEEFARTLRGPAFGVVWKPRACK